MAREGKVLDVDDRREINAEAFSVEPVLADIARNHVRSLWLSANAIEGTRITGRKHKLVVWGYLVIDRKGRIRCRRGRQLSCGILVRLGN